MFNKAYLYFYYIYIYYKGDGTLNQKMRVCVCLVGSFLFCVGYLVGWERRIRVCLQSALNNPQHSFATGYANPFPQR